MKFVNPELNKATLFKSVDFTAKEKIREVVCDKFGIEGNCVIDEMIDEIYQTLQKLEIY